MTKLENTKKKFYINDPISILFGVMCLLTVFLSIIMFIKDFHGESGSGGMGIIIMALFGAGIAFFIHGIKK